MATCSDGHVPEPSGSRDRQRRVSAMRVVLVGAGVVVAAIAALFVTRHAASHTSSAGRRRPPGVAATRGQAASARATNRSGARAGGSAKQPRAVRASDRYGSLPSWLPKVSAPVNRPIPASPRHPVLVIQGDSVAVRLPRGRAVVTAVGPRVPDTGRGPVATISPCTFVVTLTAGSGSVPITARAFTLVDDQHRIHHPRVRPTNGEPLPSTLPPHTTLSLTLHAVLPAGDGGLEWAPDGGRPVAAWDFVAETD
jgi:hypothetical protein